MLEKLPLFIWIIVAYVLFISVCCSFATDRSIVVEWGYTPPTSPKVLGFVLYQEGVKVCNFLGDVIVKGECSVNIIKTTTTFTLTASFADGTESPHSAPYNFVINIPAPTDLKITLKEN